MKFPESQNGGTVPYKAIFYGNIPLQSLFFWEVPPINRFLKWSLIKTWYHSHSYNADVTMPFPHVVNSPLLPFGAPLGRPTKHANSPQYRAAPPEIQRILAARYEHIGGLDML